MYCLHSIFESIRRILSCTNKLSHKKFSITRAPPLDTHKQLPYLPIVKSKNKRDRLIPVIISVSHEQKKTKTILKHVFAKRERKVGVFD